MSKESKAFEDNLQKLAEEWKKLGINPDDFCICSNCHKILDGFEMEGDKEEDLCKCNQLN